MAEKKTFKTWDQYTAEAEGTPFELPVSKDETLVIPEPTGAGLIQFQSAFRDGDMEAMLAAICGEKWNEVKKLLASAPWKAMENLIYDLMMHFDLGDEYELVGPGGGTVTEKDPRKVKILRKQGYKFVGEAGSRTS